MGRIGLLVLPEPGPVEPPGTGDRELGLHYRPPPSTGARRERRALARCARKAARRRRPRLIGVRAGIGPIPGTGRGHCAGAQALFLGAGSLTRPVGDRADDRAARWALPRTATAVAGPSRPLNSARAGGAGRVHRGVGDRDADQVDQLASDRPIGIPANPAGARLLVGAQDPANRKPAVSTTSVTRADTIEYLPGEYAP